MHNSSESLPLRYYTLRQSYCLLGMTNWRDEFKLGDCIMPHDVSTCWNSTFDMLNFAIEYHKAIDAISGDQNMDL